MDRKYTSEKSTSRKKVFLPRARALSTDELKTLSDNEKAFARDCRDRGVWLEIFCPDDNCLAEEERIKLPIFCDDSAERHDLWLEIFCPEGSCEFSGPTQLP